MPLNGMKVRIWLAVMFLSLGLLALGVVVVEDDERLGPAVAFAGVLAGLIIYFWGRKEGWRKPLWWSECRFHVPGDELFGLCVMTGVYGVAFGSAFGALAMLVVASGSPTASITPHWWAVVDIGGVFTLVLASVAYWSLVYRHLKRLVRGRLTRDAPEERPTLAQ